MPFHTSVPAGFRTVLSLSLCVFGSVALASGNGNGGDDRGGGDDKSDGGSCSTPPPPPTGCTTPVCFKPSSGGWRGVRDWGEYESGSDSYDVPGHDDGHHGYDWDHGHYCKPPAPWNNHEPSCGWEKDGKGHEVPCVSGGAEDCDSDETYVDLDNGSCPLQGPPGPQGPPGINGLSAAITSLPMGNTNCPTGGQMITLVTSSGNVAPNTTPAYVCNGRAGPQGPVGATGPQGATGLTGPVGPTGPTGPQGPVGPIGPIGLTGPQGLTGATGIQGPIGPQGSVGPVGPQGSAGTNGYSVKVDAIMFDDLSNCLNGGQKLTLVDSSTGQPIAGKDPAYVCNGLDGTSGSGSGSGGVVTLFIDPTDLQDCPAGLGGFFLVDNNAGQSYTVCKPPPVEAYLADAMGSAVATLPLDQNRSAVFHARVSVGLKFPAALGPLGAVPTGTHLSCSIGSGMVSYDSATITVPAIDAVATASFFFTGTIGAGQSSVTLSVTCASQDSVTGTNGVGVSVNEVKVDAIAADSVTGP